MNRRIALKQFIIFSAGVAFLPSCLNEEKKKVTAYNNIPVEESELSVLASMATIILPSTHTPGAKEIDAHLFALKMMNDCYKKEDREKFINGLKLFESNVQNQYNKSFTACSAQDQQTIVAALNAQKDAKDDAGYFYTAFKQLILKAYTSSEYYLTNIEGYKLVPGKFISSIHI